MQHPLLVCLGIMTRVFHDATCLLTASRSLFTSAAICEAAAGQRRQSDIFSGWPLVADIFQEAILLLTPSQAVI